MERLEEVRRRIASAESLDAIAGAMKALAAVRIRGFREAAEALEGYSRVLESGFQVALRDAPPAGPSSSGSGVVRGATGAGEGPAAVLVLGSDLGLVGRMNAEIVDFALPRMDAMGDVRHVGVVGSRPVAHLRSAGVEPSAVLPVPASADHLAERARDLLLVIEGWRREGVERLAVAHHAYRSGARYGPRWVPMLPLDDAWLRELAERPWPTRVLPSYRAPWQAMFRFLVREQIYVLLVRAQAEAQAAEQAGRLAAMERAERRIDEHLSELRRRFRDGRHERLTEELLDLMTGYRATLERG